MVAGSLDRLGACEPHTEDAGKGDGTEEKLTRPRNAGLSFEPEVIAMMSEAFEAARKAPRDAGAPKACAKSPLDEL
jgi:hypothetical protein